MDSGFTPRTVGGCLASHPPALPVGKRDPRGSGRHPTGCQHDPGRTVERKPEFPLRGTARFRGGVSCAMDPKTLAGRDAYLSFYRNLSTLEAQAPRITV